MGSCQGRLFRCAPNMFRILICSPVNAFISSPSVNDTILANEFIAQHSTTRAEPWLHKPQAVCFALQSGSRRQCHSTVAAQVCFVCRSQYCCPFSLLQVRASRGMMSDPEERIRYCDEALGRTVQGLNSGRSKRYFSSPNSPGGFWCPHRRLFNGYSASSLVVNCGVNHSPPSSAKDANEWSYTFMPQYVFMAGK